MTADRPNPVPTLPAVPHLSRVRTARISGRVLGVDLPGREAHASAVQGVAA